MRNPLATIKRNHGFLNAGDLPLVQVDVLAYRLSGEEGPAPSGTLGQFLQSFLDHQINANADGCRGHDFDTHLFVVDCVHLSTLATWRRPSSLLVAAQSVRRCSATS